MKNFRALVLFSLSISLLAGCNDDPTSFKKTLTLQPGTEGKDAAVGSCIPCSYNDNNYGSGIEFTAFAGTNGGNPSNIRSLIQFDLSEIPSNATITEAKLSLFHFTSVNGNHSGANNAKLLKVTAAWEENTVTWDTQPTTTLEGAVSLEESLFATQDYLDIDVTDLIQDMVSDSESNYGFMLKLDTESPYRSMIFATSDNTEESIRPLLVVKYKYEK